MWKMAAENAVLKERFATAIQIANAEGWDRMVESVAPHVTELLSTLSASPAVQEVIRRAGGVPPGVSAEGADEQPASGVERARWNVSTAATLLEDAAQGFDAHSADAGVMAAITRLREAANTLLRVYQQPAAEAAAEASP